MSNRLDVVSVIRLSATVSAPYRSGFVRPAPLRLAVMPHNRDIKCTPVVAFPDAPSSTIDSSFETCETLAV